MHTYVELAKGLPGVTLTRGKGCIVCSGPSNLSFSNFAGLFDYPSLEAASEILELVRGAGEPGETSPISLFAMPGDHPLHLHALFDSWGFHPRYELAQMGWRPGEPYWAQVEGPCMVLASTPDHRLKAAGFMTEQFFPLGKSEVKRSVIQATLASPHDLYTISSGGEIIAAVMLSRCEQGVGLYNLCVRVGWRRRGLGRRLVALCQEEAVSAGLPLTLQCHYDLALWYEASGFRLLGSLLSYYESPPIA
jgi:GNAT superfamily N-acetyltransferase